MIYTFVVTVQRRSICRPVADFLMNVFNNVMNIKCKAHGQVLHVYLNNLKVAVIVMH